MRRIQRKTDRDSQRQIQKGKNRKTELDRETARDKMPTARQ